MPSHYQFSKKMMILLDELKDCDNCAAFIDEIESHLGDLSQADQDILLEVKDINFKKGYHIVYPIYKSWLVQIMSKQTIIDYITLYILE